MGPVSFEVGEGQVDGVGPPLPGTPPPGRPPLLSSHSGRTWTSTAPAVLRLCCSVAIVPVTARLSPSDCLLGTAQVSNGGVKCGPSTGHPGGPRA